MGKGGVSPWALVVRKAKPDRNQNAQHLLSVYPSARHCAENDM